MLYIEYLEKANTSELAKDKTKPLRYNQAVYSFSFR